MEGEGFPGWLHANLVSSHTKSADSLWNSESIFPNCLLLGRWLIAAKNTQVIKTIIIWCGSGLRSMGQLPKMGSKWIQASWTLGLCCLASKPGQNRIITCGQWYKRALKIGDEPLWRNLTWVSNRCDAIQGKIKYNMHLQNRHTYLLPIICTKT